MSKGTEMNWRPDIGHFAKKGNVYIVVIVSLKSSFILHIIKPTIKEKMVSTLCLN